MKQTSSEWRPGAPQADMYPLSVETVLGTFQVTPMLRFAKSTATTLSQNTKQRQLSPRISTMSWFFSTETSSDEDSRHNDIKTVDAHDQDDETYWTYYDDSTEYTDEETLDEDDDENEWQNKAPKPAAAPRRKRRQKVVLHQPRQQGKTKAAPNAAILLSTLLGGTTPAPEEKKPVIKKKKYRPIYVPLSLPQPPSMIDDDEMYDLPSPPSLVYEYRVLAS